MRTVVLLVDDQPIVADAVRRMLAGEPDLDYHACTDPLVALKRAGEVEPTVILQDLVMPAMDGLTLVRLFRESPRTAGVPIIVMSSKEDPRDKSRAFAAGASDYVVKIPDKIELVARIRAHSRSYIAQRERDHAFAALEKLRAELEATNAELQRLSSLDGLTGLANRRIFDLLLAKEWLREQRRAQPLSVILIDLDFFKQYNDRYGHIQGDDCLRKVAGALSTAARRPGDLVARFGGEEFAVLLPETPRAGAESVAALMRERVAALAIPHEGSTVAKVVTLSQGIASCVPSPSSSTTELLERADRALYAVKQSGRNGHGYA
jgi:two-component system, chemotaxis family, response regulator WspR